MANPTSTPRPVGLSEARPIYKIAQEIYTVWKPVNYAAAPYLKAMLELTSVRDHYLYDSGKEIVTRFLLNASTWRGEDARRIKAELKARIR